MPPSRRQKAIGPFFGLSSELTTLLQLVVGAAEFSAGLVFLAVFWGEALSLVPEKATPGTQAMILCAVTGMIFIIAGAFVFNWVVEQKVKKVIPYAFLFLLSVLFAQRMQVTGVESLPPSWLDMVYGFPCACALGLLCSLTCAAKYGAEVARIRTQMEDSCFQSKAGRLRKMPEAEVHQDGIAHLA